MIIVVHDCTPSYVEGKDSRIVVQHRPRQKFKTLPENAKRVGSVAQVVEFLPSKPKAPVKNSLLPK
jgi:hypothetical protein